MHISLKSLGLGIGLALATSVGAFAAPMLAVQVSVDGNTLGAGNITSGSATSTTGILSVTYQSQNFSAISIGAQGAPVLPSPNFSNNSLEASSTGGTHTLVIKVTQTGITDPTSVNLLNTFTGNTLASLGRFSTFTIANYIDASNTAFGMANLMASANYSGGTEGSFSTGPISYGATPGSLWSETSVYTITFTGNNASISASAQIINTAVPEPMTLALFGAGLLGLSVAQRARKRA